MQAVEPGVRVAVVVKLLGEVVARANGRSVELGPSRQRCVLAALAVDAGRVVLLERLVDRVWGSESLPRAKATLQSYISRLRRALTDVDGLEIVHRSGGYLLDVDETAVDLSRFRVLCARARNSDVDTEAVDLLREALDLWHGEALTGLDGDWVVAERHRLARELLAAEHDLVDARLRLGQGEELVTELASRTAEHPLDSRVAGQHMLALYRAGRAGDALEHYRRHRQQLVEELGTDPDFGLENLHRRILDADPSLITAPRPVVASPHVAPIAVPRQLPASPSPFVGRHAELDTLDAALEEDPAAAVVINAIAGTGGIGKTWLALGWAHRHLDRYPDGQLFVDLHGFSPDGNPTPPAVVIRGFLDALGVDPGNIPADPDAQTALYRSTVAGRRMLIVLDNAAATGQVVPLLPGGNTCAVVVTSRKALTGLITRHGAHHLHLDTLRADEARALLVRRLGTARVMTEPEAVRTLLASCGGLPLALGIVASHARIRPHVPLDTVAAELRDLGVGALDDDDPTSSLPTVLSWSHRTLTAGQRKVFALLGIAPGHDIGLPAIVALTGLPATQAKRILGSLEEVSLVVQDIAGRWRMHDLVRSYAATTTRNVTEEPPETALRRLLDFYTWTAHTADRLLDPHRQAITLSPAAHVHPLPHGWTALDWFDTEHANLLAAQEVANTRGWHQTAWQLAWTLTAFHYRRGRLHDRLTVWRVALDAAGHLARSGALTLAHRFLGVAHADLGNREEAAEHLYRALELAEEHQDLVQQAFTHRMLAQASGRWGDDRRAVDHATKSLDLLRVTDQPVAVADALNQVGWFAARLGDHATARARCEAALRLQRNHHNTAGEAATLDSLGYIDHHTGRHGDAVRHYREALARYRDLGNTYEIANTLDNLGHPYAALGQHDEARSAWHEAMKLYRAQGRDDAADRAQRQLDA